eukprot:gene835-1090_t
MAGVCYQATSTKGVIMTNATIFKAAAALVLVAGLAACNKPAEPMGPAQKAGAAIDNAGAQVADKLNENIEKADQAAKQVAESAKATGREIENATAEAADDAARGLVLRHHPDVRFEWCNLWALVCRSRALGLSADD